MDNLDYKPRIGGFSVTPNGNMGLVWLSYDQSWDIIRVHHATRWDRPHLGHVATEINRFPQIPVAWSNEEYAEELRREYRCRMLKKGVSNTQEKAEELTNVMAERIATGRLQANKVLAAWQQEAEMLNRDQKRSQIPRDTHPLMAATRYALDSLKYARVRQAPSNQSVRRVTYAKKVRPHQEAAH